MSNNAINQMVTGRSDQLSPQTAGSLINLQPGVFDTAQLRMNYVDPMSTLERSKPI